MQGDIEGRLLSYSPATGQTQVLADNIWQANGVALSHDESFIVVASTPSMRLYRYWLKGRKVPYMPVSTLCILCLLCLSAFVLTVANLTYSVAKGTSGHHTAVYHAWL